MNPEPISACLNIPHHVRLELPDRQLVIDVVYAQMAFESMATESKDSDEFIGKIQQFMAKQHDFPLDYSQAMMAMIAVRKAYEDFKKKVSESLGSPDFMEQLLSASPNT